MLFCWWISFVSARSACGFGMLVPFISFFRLVLLVGLAWRFSFSALPRMRIPCTQINRHTPQRLIVSKDSPGSSFYEQHKNILVMCLQSTFLPADALSWMATNLEKEASTNSTRSHDYLLRLIALTSMLPSVLSVTKLNNCHKTDKFRLFRFVLFVGLAC